MRVVIAAVGRARAGPARDLFDHSVGRITWPITLREVEERRPLPPDRLRAREAELLLAALPDGARIVALDERGKALSSPEFAERVRRWRDDGVSDLAFVIGGAEGLDDGLAPPRRSGARPRAHDLAAPSGPRPPRRAALPRPTDPRRTPVSQKSEVRSQESEVS